MRVLTAGFVGAALILVGLAALDAPDPGSQIGVFPLLTVGGTLSATAAGVALVALMRWRRSRKLPRAIVVRS